MKCRRVAVNDVVKEEACRCELAQDPNEGDDEQVLLEKYYPFSYWDLCYFYYCEESPESFEVNIVDVLISSKIVGDDVKDKDKDVSVDEGEVSEENNRGDNKER